MAKAHGKAREELERVGSDSSVDDAEGSAREDSWLGRGAHSGFDSLVRRFGKQPS
jgi:hypothetical protein